MLSNFHVLVGIEDYSISIEHWGEVALSQRWLVWKSKCFLLFLPISRAKRIMCGHSYNRFAYTTLVVVHSVVSDSLQPHGLQLASLPRPSPSSGAFANSCSLSQWFYPTSSSSVIPFSSCLQSFPGSGSFHMSRLFASGGQSIGVSASASGLPVNIQDWFPLGLTGLISSWQSKGLSRVQFPYFNHRVPVHKMGQMMSISQSTCEL